MINEERVICPLCHGNGFVRPISSPALIEWEVLDCPLCRCQGEIEPRKAEHEGIKNA
jgi:hypothetical protein